MEINEKIKKTLSSIILASALTFGGVGCSYQPEYQEGKVIKEGGSIANIVESSGALFGNESVKFGNQNYVLSVDTEQGKYVIYVREYHSKPIAALAEAIEVGDRVRFKTNYMNFGNKNYFSEDRIGSVPSHEIELLGKERK